MADKLKDVALDRVQVKKAVQALQAFLKTKSSSDSQLLDESQNITLLFTLWKIPKKAQTIRIPLSHGFRSNTDEVCLFTRDEPNMTPDQTQRFYKKLLAERGVKNITEVIPFKTLKTEYKPFEAKRRLLGNFDMFLSDDRIRRMLPSHIGKHFYERKKEPRTVNLQSKKLALDIHRIIQGTSISITNKGCCCMTRVGHSGMTADEITENIESVVATIVTKLTMKGPLIKLIHLKSQSSVALPIYNSKLSQQQLVEEGRKQAKTQPSQQKPDVNKVMLNETSDSTAEKDEEIPQPTKPSQQKPDKKVTVNETSDATTEKDDEIPQLVPIVTPSKRVKLEKPAKKRLEKAPKSTGEKTSVKGKGKITEKAAKNLTHKVKRKTPKS